MSTSRFKRLKSFHCAMELAWATAPPHWYRHGLWFCRSRFFDAAALGLCNTFRLRCRLEFWYACLWRCLGFWKLWWAVYTLSFTPNVDHSALICCMCFCIHDNSPKPPSCAVSYMIWSTWIHMIYVLYMIYLYICIYIDPKESWTAQLRRSLLESCIAGLQDSLNSLQTYLQLSSQS